MNLNYTKKLGTRSRAASLDVSAWYTYFNNQIIPDYDTDPNKIIYDNLNGHAISKGVSANLEFNFWQRLKGNLGATFQDVAKYEELSNGKLQKQTPVFG